MGKANVFHSFGRAPASFVGGVGVLRARLTAWCLRTGCAALRPPHVLLSLAALFFIVSCTEPASAPSQSFYHWKSAWSPDTLSRFFLDSCRVQRIYFRVLDIDLHPETHKAVPVASVNLPTHEPYEFVPVVFITERTMRNTLQKTTLAANIVRKVRELAGNVPFRELQLDCDWTASSRDNFFSLIRDIRASEHDSLRITCTIRLHQWHRPDMTGIPPADGGVLMCYNTGNADNPDEANAIFSPWAVSHYLPDSRYPLSLDLALPLFSWARIYRDGALFKLAYGVSTQDSVLADTAMVAPLADNQFRVRKAGYRWGYYLQPDDLVRVDAVSQDSLDAAVQLLRHHLDYKRMIWYHLDSASLHGRRLLL